MLLYFLIGPVFRLRLLGFFTAGLAAILSAIALLVPAWDRPYEAGIFGGNPWIELHAALAILSYGMFAIVAIVSAMFLIQQHGQKTKQFKGIYQYLPTVQQLDTMAMRLLITGLSCLSAALVFGAVFWLENPDLVPVFKLSVTCLVWAGYLTVVVLRSKDGWSRGATPSRPSACFSSLCSRSGRCNPHVPSTTHKRSSCPLNSGPSPSEPVCATTPCSLYLSWDAPTIAPRWRCVNALRSAPRKPKHCRLNSSN